MHARAEAQRIKFIYHELLEEYKICVFSAMYDIDKGHVSVEEVHDIIKEEDQAIIEEELIENKTEREKIIKNASDIISDVK